MNLIVYWPACKLIKVLALTRKCTLAGVTHGPSHVEPTAEPSSSGETANTSSKAQRKARGSNLGCGSGWWRPYVFHRRASYLSTFLCSDFQPRTPVDRTDSSHWRVRETLLLCLSSPTTITQRRACLLLALLHLCWKLPT